LISIHPLPHRRPQRAFLGALDQISQPVKPHIA
jgi:hypothetical protein